MEGLNYDIEHKIHLEEIIIGSCLIDDTEEFKKIVIKHNLIVSDFHVAHHQEVFNAILKCYAENITPDIVTISQHRPQVYRLNGLGTSAKDWDSTNVLLTQKVASTAHFENHVMMFKEYLIIQFWNRVADSIQIMNWSERDKLQVSDNIINKYNDLYRRLTDGIKKVVGETDYESEMTQKFLNNQSGIKTAVTTGSHDINDLIDGGWYNGEFIIIAGRPGMGKTTIALICAWQAHKIQETEVIFFSLEMPVNQLKNKIISHETGIDYLRIKNGEITVEELAIISNYNKKIDKSGFHIIGNINHIDEITNKAREFNSENKAGLVVIDYIQLIKFNQADLRQGTVYVTRELKSLAKEIYSPIIALSQLSRACESRQNKRPMLSDLKESGSLEEDADIVIFPYRHSYYSEIQNETILEQDKWKTEFTVSKGRDTGVGTVMLDINPINLVIKPYAYLPIDFGNK